MDYENSLFANIEKAYEAGLITEVERDEAISELIDQLNSEDR